MGTCDVCGGMASYKDGTVYTAGEFRKMVAKGLGPDESFIKRMNLYGLTNQQAVNQWRKDLVTKSTTDWLLCPSCAAKAAKYMPRPAGTGPRSGKLTEKITLEIPASESSKKQSSCYVSTGNVRENIIDKKDFQSVLSYSEKHNTSVLSILFTDIEDSTSLRENLGENGFTELLEKHDSLILPIVENSGGQFVKNIGDSILAVFSQPSDAVECSINIQDTIHNAPLLNPFLKVRIGIDMGQIIKRQDSEASIDVFGRFVNRAARVESLANGGHTLTTDTIQDNAARWIDPSKIKWHHHGVFSLKGIEKPLNIWEPYNANFSEPDNMDQSKKSTFDDDNKHEKDFGWVLFKAESGDIHLQDHLGNLYYYGEGVPQDYSKALLWYQRAAEQGYDRAQYNLANMYNFGKGVSKNYEEAVKWYRRSAEQGFDMAQFNLAGAYFGGKGVPQDYSKAMHWHGLAAEQGLAKAQTSMGVMYWKGCGVSPDYSVALSWFRKAMVQGNENAKKFIALIEKEINRKELNISSTAQVNSARPMIYAYQDIQDIGSAVEKEMTLLVLHMDSKPVKRELISTKSLPSVGRKMSLAIYHLDCNHAQDVLLNCRGYADAIPYVEKALKRGTCKSCGNNISKLCLVVLPNKVLMGDPNAIDISKTLKSSMGFLKRSFGGKEGTSLRGAEDQSGEKEIRLFINELISDNSDVRERAFEALKKVGDAAVEPLIETLEHENLMLRRQAAEALGMINTQACIQALLNVFSDPRSEMFRRANYALWLIGEPVVSSLVEKLRDDDPNVRSRATIAFGQMIHRRMADPSDRIWLDPSAIDPTDNIRGDINVEAVRSEARGPLEKLLKDEDESVRKHALIALETGYIKPDRKAEAKKRESVAERKKAEMGAPPLHVREEERDEKWAEWKEKAERLKDSLELDPLQSSVMLKLGRVLYKLGRWDEARSAFKKVVTMNGIVYGDDDKAMEWMKKMDEEGH